MTSPESDWLPSRGLFHIPTRYALLALVRLPSDGSFQHARTLAEELGLPGPFLAKILQDLSHVGILDSQRGPFGGFRLARPAEAVSVREVVDALEGHAPWDPCLLWHPSGASDCHCPMRPVWNALLTLIDATMTNTTLADLRNNKA